LSRPPSALVIGLGREQLVELLLQPCVDLFLLLQLLRGGLELVAGLFAEAGCSLLDPIRTQCVEQGRGQQKENDEASTRLSLSLSVDASFERRA